MKSIINSKNIGNIPLVYILLLLFFYLCPNIKFLSIGEMSSLPAFIILLTYSFLSVKEIFIFATLGILSILSLLLYAFNFEYPETIINSSLISFYIISVPIMLSIIFGKMFAFRFYFMSKLRIITIKDLE